LLHLQNIQVLKYRGRFVFISSLFAFKTIITYSKLCDKFMEFKNWV
jgi:hypothetical protein